MSYYGNEPWSAGGRQPSWEQQPQPPSRSGTSSAGAREEPNAFAYQLAEVDRAIDNLVKSGKYPLGFPGGARRDSMPMIPGRGYPEFGKKNSASSAQRPLNRSDPRMGPVPRHHSVGDFDGGRSHSASNLQNFFANQRYGSRPNDGDQAMQARRRAAAQRERELRNYHQEQQYHKHLSGAKSDRSMSPAQTALSEDERRELIARQHRALYGDGSDLYGKDPSTSRPVSQDARVTTSMGVGGLRGSSPLAFDPFGMQGQNNSGEPVVQMPAREGAQSKDAAPGTQRSRANSTSSPSSNPNTSFSLFDNTQSSRTSTSSPTGGSPPRQGAKQTPTAGVAPIGTRPSQNQTQPGGNLQKRSTTPLPSPLSFAFSASDAASNERSTSASSNPPSSVPDKGVGLGWGSNSGVWGTSKGSLGVQASVWG